MVTPPVASTTILLETQLNVKGTEREAGRAQGRHIRIEVGWRG